MKEMRRLGGSWNAAVHAAQRCIEADTAWTGRTRGMLLRTWIRPTAMGLRLSLAIYGGCQATTCWLSTSTQRRIDT